MERFGFGKNWLNYSKKIDEDAIMSAVENLEMNFSTNLRGKSFLDIGCGSGLFSLAAVRLGATVTCFDFDNYSVETTNTVLKNNGVHPSVAKAYRADILDKTSMSKISKHDYVYSWGVLHHTGNMRLAFDNTMDLVKDGGELFIAIYNDQGIRSKLWSLVKYLYCSSLPLSFLIIVIFAPYFYLRSWLRQIIKKSKIPRGMSTYNDMVDWLGGYPFEVARPEAVIDYFGEKGFRLLKSNLVGQKLGCNEFIFAKDGLVTL